MFFSFACDGGDSRLTKDDVKKFTFESLLAFFFYPMYFTLIHIFSFCSEAEGGVISNKEY